MTLNKNLVLIFLILVTEVAIAQGCYQSSIVSPTPFMGNNGEIFKLDDGSLWEVKYEYEYLYEYSPQVIICPSKNRLVIAGVNLNIQYVGSSNTTSPRSQPRSSTATNIIESQIDGEFTGWDGETIFQLTNGQIWQQSDYTYMYRYRYRPRVMILPINGRFELQVEGIDKRVKVVRIR